MKNKLNKYLYTSTDYFLLLKTDMIIINILMDKNELTYI